MKGRAVGSSTLLLLEDVSATVGSTGHDLA